MSPPGLRRFGTAGRLRRRAARLPVREDPFSGEARPRLGRIARDLDAVVTDAQSRDWVADRADRVGFARLGQVRYRVRTAAGRSPGLARVADPVAVLLGVTVWSLVTGALLAVLMPGVTRWAGVLLVAGAAVAGSWAALVAVMVLRHLRRRWDRLDPGGPAPIDDPYRYAAFRRRIEACAAVARGDRRYGTASDLEQALDWLSAAGERAAPPVNGPGGRWEPHSARRSPDGPVPGGRRGDSREGEWSAGGV